MSQSKLILLMILFIVAGILFFVSGIYFRSEKFLGAISRAIGNKEKADKLRKSGKICASIAMGIGAFTIFCGLLIKVFPEIVMPLSLIYILIMMVCLGIIILFLK